MRTPAVIGREAELAAIRRVFDDAMSRPVGLLVEGEAGIGKSALLDAAVAEACERGFTVLSSRAAEAEASWSLLAVADLIDGVASEELGPLPEPQRRALDVVMRRAEPDGRPVEQATIAAGLRGVVKRLASERPVLMLLDDVHWLDEASATVLGRLLRRLGDERVAVLSSRRLPEQPRLDLSSVLPADAASRLQLGPLSLGALRPILESRLPVRLTRSTLGRIYEASQGNPLFALEICRVLEEVGVPPVDEPLPVPSDVQELIRRRVAHLLPRTTQLLLRAALAGGSSGAVVPATLGEHDLSVLAEAERAGIVRLDGGRVRFAHPFHAAAILANAPIATVRGMRAQLAEVATTPEERARHLARAVEDPAGPVADAIEEGARAAVARGAPLDAALLLERAWRLTPGDQRARAVRRALEAAEWYVHVGEYVAAERVLDACRSLDLEAAEEAEAKRLVAHIRFAHNDLSGAESALGEAVDIDPGAHRCALDLIVIAAQRRDFQRAQRSGEALLARLDPSTQGPLCAEVLAALAMVGFRAGEGIDWEKVERAVELEDLDLVPIDSDPPSTTAAYLAFYGQRYDEARRRLAAVRDDLADRGLEDGYVHTWLWHLEAVSGNFGAAADHIDEGLVITELMGNTSVRDQLLAGRAVVEAHLGDLDAVRRRLGEPLGEGGITATDFLELKARALAALSESDHHQAWIACQARVEQVEVEGVTEPTINDWVVDAVEAMIGVGLTDRAAALVDNWEQRSRALDYPWALALGARCRALLHAAAAEHEAAITTAEEALDHHRESGQPFQRARTLLVLGEAQRQVRRRADARRTLSEAVAEFERMGCRVWAERASEEIARIGGRAQSDGGLSVSERRVVELAAEGASNKEIAATLSVSVHTIESHLSHAFVKLGVARRTQLAARLAEAPRSD